MCLPSIGANINLFYKGQTHVLILILVYGVLSGLLLPALFFHPEVDSFNVLQRKILQQSHLYNQVLVTCVYRTAASSRNLIFTYVLKYCFCASGKPLTGKKNKEKKQDNLRLFRHFLKNG